MVNVNVMLEQIINTIEGLVGKEFPCPVCGIGLGIRKSQKGKPYCVCDSCGIQLFVRGKLGITRLNELVNSESLVSGKVSTASRSVTLYNHLEQLKFQRAEMESKQGLIFRDRDLENAILVVSAEISRNENELEKLAKEVSKRKKR